MKQFNLSYSLYSTFKTSPLQFYFEKLSGLQPTDITPEVYGKVGNILHDALEEYIKNSDFNCENFFMEQWYAKSIPAMNGLFNTKPKQENYLEMIERGKKIVDSLRRVNIQLVPEERIDFYWEEAKINVKGFIDVVSKNDGVIVLLDWKSDSQTSYDKHRLQRLFYSWLWYKKYNVVPKECVWWYLKSGKPQKDSFTIEEIKEFEKEVLNDVKTILEDYKDDVSKYPVGNYNSPFNAFKTACLKEQERREKKLKFGIAIWGNWCQLVGNISDLLRKGLDRKFSYEKKNAEYIKRNSDWDGVVHLYNVKKDYFPTGLLPEVKQVLKEYADYMKIPYEIAEKDMRQFTGDIDMPDKLIGIELRSYQQEAVDAFMKEKYGIVKLKTGCVDADTEYLTEHGWKKISNYDGEKIMQYNLDGSAEFVKPDDYIKTPCDKMYQFETKYGLNQCLSEEHKVLYLDHNNDNKIIFMKNLYEKHQRLKYGFSGKFLCSFSKLNNGTYRIFNDDEIKLITAIVADGTIVTYKNGNKFVRFNLKKDRKKDRLKKLLKKLNINYSIKKSSVEGFHNIYFNWNKATKEYGKWYNLTYYELKIFAEESLLWDGNSKNSYYTTIKSNADFIQYCFSAIDKKTSLNIYDRRGRERIINNNIYITKSKEYVVVVSNKRNTTTISNSQTSDKINIKKVIPKDGYKYCFSVKSGFLVLRRNNCIFITGNSGKTITAAEIIRKVGKKTLWIIDRVLLMSQTKEVLESVLGVEVGQIGEGVVDIKDVTVCTYQTLVKRMPQIKDELSKEIGFLICDECHHASSNSIKTICGYCKNTEYRMGISATPDRKEEWPEIRGLLGDIVYKLENEDERYNEFLCEVDIQFLDIPENSQHHSTGQYSDDYVGYIVDNVDRNEYIKKLCEEHKEKNILVITKAIDHATILSHMLDCPKLIGGTPEKERQEIAENLKTTRGNVIIGSVQVISEGWDVPQLDMVINATGMSGEIKTIQGLGRVLRKSEDKEKALYFDFCDIGNKYFRAAARNRYHALKNEGFKPKIIKVK